MRRKETLVCGEVYHIFTKSIADYRVFSNKTEFLRMRDIIRYYQIENISPKFSQFLQSERERGNLVSFSSLAQNKEKLVQIIAYCLMPTHIHLILKQLKEKGISLFMGNLLNSYSRFFNLKHKRKGPLWEGKFKNKLVNTEEQLLHLTRYIHLNPTSAGLVKNPEEWLFSSYREYIGLANKEEVICDKDEFFDLSPETYREFVEDRIAYQRELEKIKSLLLE
ncbi:MAG: transposase [Candidatus Omnitrophica bacterium]|nr:transposase [Candidatus Omnitrophota bacterium]MCM8792959.1 transposase [Candidatus Omnitrophota bacterium]